MQLSDILVENADFRAFGTSHWATLAFFFLLTVVLVQLGRNRPFPTRDRIARGIAWTLVGTLLIWTAAEILRGVLDPKVDLPFDLCNVNCLLIPLVLVRRSAFWAQNLYFWVMAGTMQGVLTPAIWEDFPHYTFIKFFVVHCGLVVAVLYAALVLDLRPTYRGLWQAVACIHGYALFALCANFLLDANYGFLCRKPDTASLLDLLGPHPWYLFAMEGLGIAVMHLMWLPWAWKGRV
jgi:hypothetical integral membrane protein (TIGR02206 family)